MSIGREHHPSTIMQEAQSIIVITLGIMQQLQEMEAPSQFISTGLMFGLLAQMGLRLPPVQEPRESGRVMFPMAGSRVTLMKYISPMSSELPTG